MNESKYIISPPLDKSEDVFHNSREYPENNHFQTLEEGNYLTIQSECQIHPLQVLIKFSDCRRWLFNRDKGEGAGGLSKFQIHLLFFLPKTLFLENVTNLRVKRL